MNKILCGLLMAAAATTAFAQGGTNSPYSQFGLGELSPQGVGFNKGMNGLGIALHRGNQTNPVNPASYASMDSLTFLFDMGMSGEVTNFKEGGKALNARTGNFDYAIAAFRVLKGLGMSFGIMPLTDVGYEYSSSAYLPEAKERSTVTYSGDGGFNKLFVGIGGRIAKPLSVGVNVSYLWGHYYRGVTSVMSTNASLYKLYEAEAHNFAVDFGLQYDQKLSKNDKLTLGLTYGFGHKLNADAHCSVISSNSLTGKADSTKFTAANALAIPHTFGAGLAYTHGQSLTIGVDAEMQKWGSLEFPTFDSTTDKYVLQKGLLKDSYRFVAGLEWVPNPTSRRFFDRVRYRIGGGYRTPYYKINESDGPKEISASIGFGIPIFNNYNTRSLVNVSGQWVRRSAEGFVTENTFRINIGLTFNERWFAKWRVE